MVIGITRLVCKPSPQGEEQQLHAQYNNQQRQREQCSDVIRLFNVTRGARLLWVPETEGSLQIVHDEITHVL